MMRWGAEHLQLIKSVSIRVTHFFSKYLTLFPPIQFGLKLIIEQVFFSILFLQYHAQDYNLLAFVFDILHIYLLSMLTVMFG